MITVEMLSTQNNRIFHFSHTRSFNEIRSLVSWHLKHPEIDICKKQGEREIKYVFLFIHRLFTLLFIWRPFQVTITTLTREQSSRKNVFFAAFSHVADMRHVLCCAVKSAVHSPEVASLRWHLENSAMGLPDSSVPRCHLDSRASRVLYS